MQSINRLVFGILLVIASTMTFAANVSVDSIKQLGANWEQAIASRNPSKITALYDKDALLYATFSNVVDSQAGIKQYFTKLTKHKDLKVIFTKQNIRVYGDAAINSGLYEFSYNEHGKTVKVPGRYTFVYHETPSGWVIIDHHSSVLPEKSN